MMRFTGDEARDLVQSRNITAKGVFPLLGPKIYRQQGHLGPAYAYLMAIPLWLNEYDPAVSVKIVTFFDLCAIVLIFLLGTELFDQRSGLLAALFYAVSFTMVFYSRWGWHPSLVPCFTILSFCCMINVIKGRIGYLPVLAVCLGLLVQFHLSTALLAIPAIVALWQARRLVTWRTTALSLLLALAVLSPLIISEWQTWLGNARAILQLQPIIVGESKVSFWTFLLDISQVIADQAFWPFGSRKILLEKWRWVYWINVGLVAASLLFVAVKLRHSKPRVIWILVLWAIVPPLSLLNFAGQRSHYYMLSWFPLPILLVSGMLSTWATQRAWVWLCAVLVGLVTVINLATYQRYMEWIAQEKYDTFLAGPLRIKKQAVDAVIRDAGDWDYDLLVISWHWNNNLPYTYLIANADNLPRTIEILVIEGEKPATLHPVDTSSYFRSHKETETAELIYCILEPDTLVDLPDTELITDLGQLSVRRSRAPIIEFFVR